MPFLIFLILLAGPIAEIYVLLAAGGAFGVWPVVAACVATAAIGAAVIRFQGLSALTKAQADIAAGRPPVASAIDGVFLLIAAPLLMTPGFLTDALGFLLLVPPLRQGLARAALRWVSAKIAAGESIVIIRRP